MTRGDWCTEASWTTAGQETGTLSRVPIFVRRSTRVLAGRPVSGDQKASVGCNIKWRDGNEPESLSGARHKSLTHARALDLKP